MNLTCLHDAPHLTIYADTWNNWLFLDWQGNLTLDATQAACLALLACCCAYPCARVLNSNARLVRISGSATAWLAREFLPQLAAFGVEQIAWVRSPSPEAARLAEYAPGWLPQLLVAAFDELEPAVEWLTLTQSPTWRGPRPSPEPALVQARVQSFVARVTAQRT